MIVPELTLLVDLAVDLVVQTLPGLWVDSLAWATSMLLPAVLSHQEAPLFHALRCLTNDLVALWAPLAAPTLVVSLRLAREPALKCLTPLVVLVVAVAIVVKKPLKRHRLLRPCL